MRIRASIAAALLVAGVTLTGCSSATHPAADKAGGPAVKATEAAAKGGDATADYAIIRAAVPGTTLTATVTAANDGNHLLGRPHQYTSAIKFADSHIKAADVEGLDKDDVTRGGGIEVFDNHDDAQTRADYIQKVTKGIPALSEYDYVSGRVVVRVSYLLTPDQAGEYKAAAAKLG